MSVRFEAYARAFRSSAPLASENTVVWGHLPAGRGRIAETSAAPHILNTRYRMTGLSPCCVFTAEFVAKSAKSGGRRLRYATSMAPVFIASLRSTAVVKLNGEPAFLLGYVVGTQEY